jgi:D-alanyl-D-alanine carboxypeptidase
VCGNAPPTGAVERTPAIRRVMIRTTAVALLALLGACAPTPTERKDAALAASIDSIVQLVLSVDPTPGMSVAVVRGRDTLLLRGYGVADLSDGTPVTDRTPFPIGSITKSFTAAAIMTRVEDGTLRLDSTLGEMLPEYEGPGRGATLHQLLSHTSGIPSYTRAGSPYWDAVERDRTDAEMRALFAGEPLEFAPGTRFRYNNSAYYLLGTVIERVSGTPYGTYVERTLAAPAGVEEARPCYEIEDAPGHAQGYERRTGGPVEARPVSLRTHEAAGALCSTARDLVRWIRALHGGGVVSQEAYARMTTVDPAHDGPGAADVQRGRWRFGYGLIMGELDGRGWVGHTGGFAGFRAAMQHFPEEDLTLVILADGPAPVVDVAADIARAVRGTEPPRW